MIEMDTTRARNEPVLPEIRPMDDNETGKVGRAAEALRRLAPEQANQPLRNQSGSESRGGSDDGGANISCMSCDKFECSEMGPCVKFSYAPGSDEAEKVKAGFIGESASAAGFGG